MDLDSLAARFRTFAALESHGVTPLYALLAEAIAENREILRLAAGALPGQPPPNMLFGAVHYLLLSGVKHPLEQYYPSCSTEPLPAGDSAWPMFREFCLSFNEPIAGLIASRRTQTNEVARSALLLPAFAYASTLAHGRPVRLIEIGPSAGFILNWDRYNYDYGAAGKCNADSDLELFTELRGPYSPVFPELSSLSQLMAMRIGIEKQPIDLQHPADRLWLQALVWPEHLTRMERLRKAIRIAQAHPPDILQGDGLVLLPDLLAQVPAGEIPLVFHSFVRYQFNPEEQARFDKILAGFGNSRPLLHVALEWIGSEKPRLDLEFHPPGPPSSTLLATCNPHGEWLQWCLA